MSRTILLFSKLRSSQTSEKNAQKNNLRPKFWIGALLLMLMSGVSWGQVVYSGANVSSNCTSGSAGTWLTANNWCNGVIPSSGVAAQFGANGSATTIGINQNNITTAQKTFGTIELLNTNTVSRTINNSSTTASGTIVLNGSTVNAVSNVILRNNCSSLLTITDGSSKTLGISLGNTTNNIVAVDSSGGITISCVIKDSASVAKNFEKRGTGTGVLTLSGVNTYSGNTTITSGTLKLSGSGSIASSPKITIGSSGTFDVSALTNALTLAAAQKLSSSATGSNTTGTITVISGKGLTLSAGGLEFTAYGGGATAPLTVSGVSAGSLALNSSPVTITTTTQLAAGTYKLIAKGGSASVTGTPGTLTVNGSGTVGSNSLSVVSGELILTVSAATTQFYNAPNTDVTNVANWSTNTNGIGGTQPTNFTTANQTFNITNTGATMSTAWAVSGSSSKVVLGDGTNAVSFTIPSSAALTGTIGVANAATLTISNTTNPTLGTLGTTSSTVVYNAAGAQTIAAATYANLTISTTTANATAGGAIAASGTLTISSGSTLDMGTANVLSGAFTPAGTGTLKTSVPTATSATPIPSGLTWTGPVQYASASAQTVLAGTYTDLDISGGNRTLPSGTINISGTYTPGAGTLTATGNTINFNGADGQTIPAASYNSISSTNNTRTLANGTIKIAGTFTTGNGNYTIGTSTVEFNGSTAQSIPVIPVASGSNYYNLSYSGSNTATMAGSISVANNLNTSSGIFAVSASSSNTLTVEGNIVQSAGTIDFSTGNTTNSTIILKGNLTQSAASTFTTTGTSATNGLLVLAGTSNQTITYNGTDDNFVSYRINDGAIVTLGSNVVLTRSSTSQYNSVVNIGQGISGLLNLSTFAFTTTGTTGNITLNVNAGSTIQLNNSGGLNTVFPQTGLIRTFSAGANYTFNGATTTAFPTAAQQTTFGNPANINVNANITLNRNITASGTLSLTSGTLTVGANTLTLSGNTINRDGSSFVGNIDASNATATMAFTNTSSLTIPASTFTGSIRNLTMNGAGGISIGSDVTVAGTLTLTNGIITTGSNKLIIASTGSVSRTSGHIAGNLQKNIAAIGSSTFEIGGASIYRPVSINTTTLNTAGALVVGVSQADGNHPNLSTSSINTNKALKRYYSIVSIAYNGVYSPTFNFDASDVPSGASATNFVVGRYNSGTWSYPTLGTKTSTSTQITGVSNVYGDFAIGELGLPTTTTNSPTSVTTTGATINATVNDNGIDVTAINFEYGTTTGYGSTTTASPATITAGTGATAITGTLSGLNVNNQYNYRVNATNANGTVNGANVSFYTLANVPGSPTVSNPTNTTLDITIDENNNPSITEYVIHETSTNKYVQANGTLGVTPISRTAAVWGTKTIIGLLGGTQYTFEVAALNGDAVQTAYGTSSSNTTTSSVAPTVTTPTATAITNNSATLGGNVTSDGGASISARGIVWAATTDNNNPELNGTNVTNVAGSGTTGVFTVSATSLPTATQISYKAYATNSQGTSYTSASTFYTLADEPTTQATNLSFANPTSSSLDISWTNGNGGRRAVFMRESTSGTIINPSDATAYTASNDWSSKGTQLGSSGYYCIYDGINNSVSVSNLSAATNYYVRVYEYNSDGTVTASTINYFTNTGTGNPANSITLSTEPSAHTTTFNANAASTTSITLDFNGASTISNAAGYIILQKQGSSAPTSNPTDATAYSVGNTIGDGIVAAIITNTATTSTTISSLSYATQYSFKIIPYNWNASNSGTYNYYVVGTIPSASATTSTPTAPSVTTPTATSISTTTATLGGNITSNGGDPITESGIVWSVTSLESNPTIGANNVTKVVGSGTTTGTFTVSTSGLPSGVSITYRAYAANSTGTGYTAATTFTTLATQPSTLATTMTFSNTTISSIKVSWTNGNGSNRIVVARPNATTRVAPTNATGYVVSSASILDGANVTTGTGNVVVYNGSDSTVTVTSLSANTVYAFDVYEYNGSGASANYSANLTSTKSTLASEPTVQASYVTFTNVSSTGFTVNWTKGTGSDNSLVVIKDSSVVNSDPIDGTSYTANAAFGSGTQIGTRNYVLYRATLATINVTGLIEGHTYYVAVYAYNGTAGSGLENYLTTSPATGSQTAQTPTYYSQTSGDPAVLANWNTIAVGGGSTPPNFTTTANFIIQNGHNMTTTGTWSFGGTSSKLQIQNGGTLTANHAITIASGATFQIDNAGTYVHNNNTAFATSIFNGTESFANASNFEIQNYNTTGPSGITFGNLTINATNDPGGSMQCGGGITTINGNFKMQALAGAREIRFSSTTSFTLTIGGDLIVQNGILDIASSAGSSVSRTINIGGNYNQSGGTFKCTGNSNSATINFTGTNKTFTQSGGILTNTNINWGINSGASLSLVNGLPVAASRSLNINGTLDCGTSSLSGSGSVVVNNGGTIKVGSTSTSGAIAGNITATTFTLNAGSTVEYNGAAAQYMQARTFRKLSINNPAGVNMIGSVTVSDSLKLNSGFINIDTTTLSLNSAVTGSGTISGNSSSKLNINGTAGTLNFTTNANSLRNLTIGTNDTATIGTDLKITGGTAANTFGTVSLASGSVLTIVSGKTLTFESNSNGTGILGSCLGTINSGGVYGKITVERYLSTPEAWRFVSSGLNSTGTIRDNWQEGGSSPANFGTYITSTPNTGALGFDFTTTPASTNSMFTYTSGAGPWNSVANTNVLTLKAGTGYRLWVRSDRTTAIGTTTSWTRLRTTGTPVTGTVTMVNTGVSSPASNELAVLTPNSNGYSLVGNPYWSPVDWQALTKTNVIDFYWAWDPKLAGTAGHRDGRYVLVNGSNGVTNAGSNSNVSKIIQPGQAIFVKNAATGTPSIQWTESAKSSSQTAIYKTTTVEGIVKATLNEDTSYVDAAMVFYANGYNDAIDASDAGKLSNPNENISILRNATQLTMESRNEIATTDTIPLRISSLNNNYSYNLTTDINNMPSTVQGFLLNTDNGNTSPLNMNGTTMIPITVTGSLMTNYKIVFTNSGTPLSVKDIKLTASKQNNAIVTKWTATEEQAVNNYTVEKSTNGKDFTTVQVVSSKGNGTNEYTWTDEQPADGNNLYRIKATNIDGKQLYSNTALVRWNIGRASSLTIYPNPVTDANFTLSMNNMATGEYQATLYSANGQVVYTQTIQYETNNTTAMIQLNQKLNNGAYYLVLSNGKESFKQNITIQNK